MIYNSEVFYSKNSQKMSRMFLAFSLFIFFVYKMFYASKFGLTTDESYYWMWSQKLSLGYYDSGTILAWVIRFTTDLLGHSELAVRFTSIIVTTMSSILLYMLSNYFMNPILSSILVLVFNITPGGALSGILMMHDSMMIFFWILTVYSLYRAIFRNKNFFWYIAGISSGFGLWSKDTTYLIIPLTFLFLLLSKKHRFFLKTKEPYIALFLMLAIFSPILYWNYQHDWVTYRHIFALGARSGSVKAFQHIGDFLGSQLALVSPFLFIGILLAWIRSTIIYFYTKNARHLFLLLFSFSIFLFFLVLSAKSKIEGNWAGFGYIVGILCYFFNLQDIWKKTLKTKFFSYTLFASFFSFLLVFLMLNPIFLYKIAYKIPNLSGKIVEALKDNRTNDVNGWRQFGDEIAKFQKDYSEFYEEEAFFFGLRYQVSSQMAFYGPGLKTYCLPIGRRMNQYDIWWGLDKLVGQIGIFVSDGHEDSNNLEILKQYFDSVTWTRHFTVYRDDLKDEPIRSYNIYICKNFKGIDKKTFFETY